MKGRTRVIAILAILFLSATAIPLYAQSEGSKKMHEENVVGCLNKGDAEGTYVLAKEGSGEKIQVTGTAELEKHSSNHKVKLTGMMSDDGKFEASKVEHLSADCTP